MTTTPNMLPCPFCGSEPKLCDETRNKGETPWAHVWCPQCRFDGPERDDATEAITAWNTRQNTIPDTSPGAILNEYISELGDKEPFVVSRDDDGEWVVRTMAGWRVLQRADGRSVQTFARAIYEACQPFVGAGTNDVPRWSSMQTGIWETVAKAALQSLPDTSERAAIAAWLRAQPKLVPLSAAHAGANTPQRLADAIERGQHWYASAQPTEDQIDG